MSGRRPAGYYFRMEKRSDAQVALFVEEQFKELELINKIRQKVKEWRDGGYKGVPGVTERRVSGQVRVFGDGKVGSSPI